MTRAVDGLWLIDGLILSNNGTDSDHDIDIGAGLASVEGSGTYDVANLSSAITKQLDASWAVGDDAGGLDTGSIAADTWYHVWQIKRSDTEVVDALFSTSATSPTMPTDYDLKRRIGAVLTDGSSDILGFKQTEDWFYFDEPPTDVNVTSSPTTATLTTVSAPLGVETEVQCLAFVTHSGGSVRNSFWHGNQSPPTTNFLNQAIGSARDFSSSSGWTAFQTYRLFTNTSSQIYYASSSSSTDSQIITHGWRDPRGRNW